LQLRPYQTDIKRKVYDAWRNGKRRVLIFACTGSGKTVIAHSIIEDAKKKNYRVLFTCHRQILVDQSYNAFIEFAPSVIMGNDKRYNKDSFLQIGTLQTLKNREIDTPNIIIVDESHFSHNAGLLPDLLAKFPKTHTIGLSASPIDNKGYLLDGYEAYIDDYQICDLIEAGYLVPFECYSPTSIDLSNILVIAGEYDQKELEKIVIEERLLSTAVFNYSKYGKNRQFLVFATTQKHAKALERIFLKAGINVGYIDANIKKPARALVLSNFKAGNLQGLINIDVLTAGYNEATIGCIVDCSPTMRLGRYIQRTGRGGRLNGNTYEESIKNGKPNVIYLDLANNIENHDMPTIRRKFEFKPIVSRVVDKKLGLTDLIDRSPAKYEISAEKMVQLRKVGKLLDLYQDRIYNKESELQSDVNNYLDKTKLFYFRQNSGVAQYGWALERELQSFSSVNSGDTSLIKLFINFINKGQARYIRFTSKSGLADISCFYGSLFFGIELKLPHGKLTNHQKVTIPEMISKKVLFFFAESVIDIYDIICHIENNWDGNILNPDVYLLYPKQIEYYRKHKIKTYRESGVI